MFLVGNAGHEDIFDEKVKISELHDSINHHVELFQCFFHFFIIYFLDIRSNR